MPIALHLVLMILGLFAGLFSIPLLGMAWEEGFVAAGNPAWVLYALLFVVGLLGPVLLFCLIPVICRGCGWPIAFLWPGEPWIYRCRSCRHVHRARGPYGSGEYQRPTRLWPFRLDDSSVHRVTLSGHVDSPSTLVLCIRPAPPRGPESELKVSIEACLTIEQGETLLRVEGPLEEWEAEQSFVPWRTDLTLRHPQWRDIAMRGIDHFALEIRVRIANPDGRSRTLRPTLEFQRVGGWGFGGGGEIDRMDDY